MSIRTDWFNGVVDIKQDNTLRDYITSELYYSGPGVGSRDYIGEEQNGIGEVLYWEHSSNTGILPWKVKSVEHSIVLRAEEKKLDAIVTQLAGTMVDFVNNHIKNVTHASFEFSGDFYSSDQWNDYRRGITHQLQNLPITLSLPNHEWGENSEEELYEGDIDIFRVTVEGNIGGVLAARRIIMDDDIYLGGLNVYSKKIDS